MWWEYFLLGAVVAVVAIGAWSALEWLAERILGKCVDKWKGRK